MKRLIRFLTKWAWKDTHKENIALRVMSQRYHVALYQIGVLRHRNPHQIARKALD